MGNEIKFIIPQRIDLMAENPTLVYSQALEKRNGYAHEWQVHVVMGGRDVDLTGCTVVCYAARSDRNTVRIGGRVAAGCMATVVFDPTVYAITGEVAACMELVDSEGNGKTIARMYCVVSQTCTDMVIDPGEEIPSLDNLMALIDQMRAATKDAQDAAAQAQAAAQSANFTVLGQYDTIELLEAAHPTGKAGDGYAIGTEAPYIVYIWDVDKGKWQGIGQLQGAQGPRGATGKTGATGAAGKDGTSPTVAVTQIDGGHTITITDTGGAKAFDVMDGKDFAGYDQTLNKSSDVTFNSIKTAQPINAGKLNGKEASAYVLAENAEEWTFTLEDGSAVTKKVIIVD